MKLLWTVGSRSTFGPNGHFPSGTKAKSTKTSVFTPLWARTGFPAGAGCRSNSRYRKKFPPFSGQTEPAGTIERRCPARMDFSQTVASSSPKRGRLGKKLGSAENGGSATSSLPPGKIAPDSSEAISSATEAIDFLILSHHNLPLNDDNGNTNGPSIPTSGEWLVRTPDPCIEQISPAGFFSPAILDDYIKLEKKLLEKYDSDDTLFWRAILVYARAGPDLCRSRRFSRT